MHDIRKFGCDIPPQLGKEQTQKKQVEQQEIIVYSRTESEISPHP